MAEELKRHDIAFSLDLNKHPKDAINLSLINAENFRISEDGTCLTIDNKIYKIDKINNKLNEHFNKNEHIDWKIVNILSTNKEIILFVVSNYNFITSNVYINNELLGYKYLNIFRYNEEIDQISDAIIDSKLISKTIFTEKIGNSDENSINTINEVVSDIRIDALKYYGGKFSGTYTYNVKNELIIAFCEYDSIYSDKSEIGEPLQIINLGYWDSYIDDDNNEIYNLINENNLDPRTFPLCPEVTIPKIINDEIINGFSKKGWYHFYIRYKINKHDYTQWFNFGKSFYLDEYKKQTIFSYKATSATTGLEGTENKVWEESNYFSDETEVCNKSIKFDLKNIDNKYKFYQIGFVCTTKTYTTCRITNDINIENESFTLDFSSCVDYNPKEIIKVYNNYYNVKNVINYNNRLYISNYNEIKNINEETNISAIISSNPLANIRNKIIVNGNNKYVDINQNYKLKDFLPFNYVFSFDEIEPPLVNDEKEIELYKKGGFNSNPGTHESPAPFEQKLQDKFTELTTINVNSTEYCVITKILCVRANGAEEFIEIKNQEYPIDKIIEFRKYWIKRFHIYGVRYKGLKYIDTDIEYSFNESKNAFINNSVIPKTNLLVSNTTNNLKQYNFKLEKSYKVYEEITSQTTEFTLIPNQPYVFFIHYVDKYGQITNGNMLHLSNISNTILYQDDCYLCLARVHYNWERANLTIDNIFELFYKIDSLFDFDSENINDFCNSNNVIFRSHDYNKEGVKIPTIITNNNGIEGIKLYFDFNFIKEELNKIKNTFNNITSKTFGEIYTLLSYNSINIPDKMDSTEIGEITHHTIFPFINYKVISYYNKQDHGILIPYKDNNTVYNISFEGINIPKGFNSYFISYEKLNKTLVHQGELEHISSIDDDGVYNLYNDNLNYKDSIKLNNFIINKEKVKIQNIKYIVANDIKENNQGLSTKLQFLHNNDELDTIYKSIGHLFINPLELNFIKNKTLIRISEIDNSFIQNNLTTYGFLGNHFITKSKFPYRINAANNLIKYDSTKEKLQESPIETDQNIILYDYINHTSKQLNNSPKVFKVITNDVDFNNPTAEYYDAYMFLPQDTIDLFKNNALDFDSSVLNIYTNTADNVINNNKFDKTIRRSNYIQDESLSIDWRRFDTENYKIIQENKGKITNIVGVGDLLLVHTEHSLFQFNKNNLLTAINRTVQLGQQDTFDVDYKEIFSSIYGYGGLQDNESYILGEFGYIFYNNDFNKIYQYDANSINIISSNINNFLNKHKPNKILFSEDKHNRRLLIKIIYNINKELYLSYNYDTKSFLSIHKTEYEKGYNTKLKTYLINKEISSIDYDNVENKQSKLSFIINENYSKIKRLNYIKYKLYKRNNIDNEFNANSPVEGYDIPEIINNVITRRPYSGYKLRVYNDLCDTGYLDITIDEKSTDTTNEKKPYYDLGNFVFNGLRDKNTNSIIYGNFFIVEFIFEETDKKIEFESLEYNLNYEEN